MASISTLTNWRKLSVLSQLEDDSSMCGLFLDKRDTLFITMEEPSCNSISLPPSVLYVCCRLAVKIWVGHLLRQPCIYVPRWEIYLRGKTKYRIYRESLAVVLIWRIWPLNPKFKIVRLKFIRWTQRQCCNSHAWDANYVQIMGHSPNNYNTQQIFPLYGMYSVITCESKVFVSL